MLRVWVSTGKMQASPFEVAAKVFKIAGEPRVTRRSVAVLANMNQILELSLIWPRVGSEVKLLWREYPPANLHALGINMLQ